MSARAALAKVLYERITETPGVRFAIVDSSVTGGIALQLADAILADPRIAVVELPELTTS